jgi:outer membrane PBP1 activator LpoA protein
VFHHARRIVARRSTTTSHSPRIGEDGGMTTIRVVAALAAALALAGCGGGSHGLSTRALAAKANAICARYAKEGDRLTAPKDITDPRQALAFFARAHDIAARQQAELVKLVPAKAAKAPYAAMTSATGRATRLLDDLAAAARANDANQGANLLGRLQPDSDAVDRTARALGAGRCAG